MKTNIFSVDTKSAKNTTEEVINSSNFFNSANNKSGYFNCTDFISYGELMRPKERNDFAGLFEEMKKGTKMEYNMVVSTDRVGKSYIYPKFYYPRGVKGYKILVTDGIIRLINDYFEGKVKLEVSAQELYQHAVTEM